MLDSFKRAARQELVLLDLKPPRARQVVNLVVNSVTLGSHDNDAEIGALAEQLGTAPARLQTNLRKLEEQGWLTLKGDFVYPTVEALRWQNP